MANPFFSAQLTQHKIGACCSYKKQIICILHSILSKHFEGTLCFLSFLFSWQYVMLEKIMWKYYVEQCTIALCTWCCFTAALTAKKSTHFHCWRITTTAFSMLAELSIATPNSLIQNSTFEHLWECKLDCWWSAPLRAHSQV